MIGKEKDGYLQRAIKPNVLMKGSFSHGWFGAAGTLRPGDVGQGSAREKCRLAQPNRILNRAVKVGAGLV